MNILLLYTLTDLPPVNSEKLYEVDLQVGWLGWGSSLSTKMCLKMYVPGNTT